MSVTTTDGITATGYEWIGSIEGLALLGGMWQGKET